MIGSSVWSDHQWTQEQFCIFLFSGRDLWSDRQPERSDWQRPKLSKACISCFIFCQISLPGFIQNAHLQLRVRRVLSAHPFSIISPFNKSKDKTFQEHIMNLISTSSTQPKCQPLQLQENMLETKSKLNVHTWAYWKKNQLHTKQSITCKTTLVTYTSLKSNCLSNIPRIPRFQWCFRSSWSNETTMLG